jgi:replicative DNA helicase
MPGKSKKIKLMYNREAEQAVLGSMLRDNSVIAGVRATVAAEQFYTDAHQKVFRVIMDLHEQGQPADVVTAANRLKECGQIEDVKYSYLAELLAAAPTASNAEHHAGIVRDDAVRRDLISFGKKLAADAEDQVGSVEKLVTEAKARVGKISVVAGDACARIKARGLWEVTEKPVEWLMPGWIPLGKLAVLDGDPDLGKSTLLLDIAARTSTSGIMPNGQQGAVGAVVLLSAEDDAQDTIRPRLRAAGADLDRITIIDQIENRPVVLPRDVNAIKAFVLKHDVRQLNIDPVMAYLDADSRSDQEVRRALHPLKQMAEETGCAVVLQRH